MQKPLHDAPVPVCEYPSLRGDESELPHISRNHPCLGLARLWKKGEENDDDEDEGENLERWGNGSEEHKKHSGGQHSQHEDN